MISWFDFFPALLFHFFLYLSSILLKLKVHVLNDTRVSYPDLFCGVLHSRLGSGIPFGYFLRMIPQENLSHSCFGGGLRRFWYLFWVLSLSGPHCFLLEYHNPFFVFFFAFSSLGPGIPFGYFLWMIPRLTYPNLSLGGFASITVSLLDTFFEWSPGFLIPILTMVFFAFSSLGPGIPFGYFLWMIPIFFCRASFSFLLDARSGHALFSF